jgi:hypothetical protein
MSEKYMQALHEHIPVFGRISFGHLPDMQFELIKQLNLSIEEISQKFAFFYIFSKPPLSLNDNFEIKLRQRKLPLYLELTMLNIYEEDDIVEKIMNKIHEKIVLNSNKQENKIRLG